MANENFRTAGEKQPDIVDRFFLNQGHVLSEWFSTEIHGLLKGTCKAVEEHNQPCTTRGWLNAALDTKFFEE